MVCAACSDALAQPRPLPERDWVPGRLVVRAHGPEFIPMMEAEIRGLGSTIADTAHDRDYARGAAEKLEELRDDCNADLPHTDDPGDWGDGVPDGVVDADDLSYYIYWHALGNLDIADIAGTCTDCEQTTCHTPDNSVTADDLYAYICLWSAGCP